jgi:hypothetical protein
VDVTTPLRARQHECHLSFHLAYKNSLTATNWTNPGPLTIPASNSISTSDLVGANARRDYRVVFHP